MPPRPRPERLTKRDLAKLQKLVVTAEGVFNQARTGREDPRWEGSRADWAFIEEEMANVVGALRDIYGAFPELH